MGVTGLWTVVHPCARPIKIETLNRKRLAVDASIWVYQFLKAVRDKEGHALRNSHVVGFFRRICKLLFVGILPVFVFDGGAPVLKRQTVAGRKSRREGRREDAVRTAGKLLALQMHRHAEEEEAERRRRAAGNRAAVPDEPLPENLVYVDELDMTEKERQANRKFKRKDQYHLPELDVPLAQMGAPDDPRVMSLAELENYARQFDTGEDINVYDFSKIDFDSTFFTSLPASDRYNILNAARLRSRLRMGYSKEQLDKMFPDRMAFSRFQIERVAERNELTARLMNINGMGDDPIFDGSGRVAGEKGREYVLVKNPGVEGGWALGVIGDRDKEEGEASKPIDIEDLERKAAEEAKAVLEDNQSDEEPQGPSDAEVERRRRAFYDSRKDVISRTRRSSEEGAEPDQAGPDQAEDEDEDGLFVGDAAEAAAARLVAQSDDDSTDDEELQRAIAMSLGEGAKASSSEDEEEERPKFDPSTFKQQKAADYNPFAKRSSGKASHIANIGARKAAPVAATRDESDDEMDFASAMAKSRQAAGQKLAPPVTSVSGVGPAPASDTPSTPKRSYVGPLPFEKLDLGSSLLGEKKMKQIQEEQAGGFERDDGKKKPAAPLPPWFSKENAVKDDLDAQKAVEDEDRRREREASDERYEREMNKPTLRKHLTNEVIDVDALDTPEDKVVVVDESDEEKDDVYDEISEKPLETETTEETTADREERSVPEDKELRMGDLADKIRVEPPPAVAPAVAPTAAAAVRSGPFQDSSASESDEENISGWEESGDEQERPGRAEAARIPQPAVAPPSDPASKGRDPPVDRQPEPQKTTPQPITSRTTDAQSTDQVCDRNESIMNKTADGDPRLEDTDNHNKRTGSQDQPSPPSPPSEREDSPDDVFIPDEAFLNDDSNAQDANRPTDNENVPASAVADQDMQDVVFVGPGEEEEEEDLYSDPEDEELMLSLANEAEEHARFASTFNNKTQRQNIEEYERELKALRTQQKKDRRDADEVTQVMIQECQQLLKMFGLPYITAPMEAEAQCAELVRLGLVDGIVTDDSDTFLFGGTRIYKNMFNQAKFVECYLASDLEKEFDLTREKLIRIAHLLGSDYTEGLPGIGPVNALEIISDFSEGLHEFKDWWTLVQSGARPAKEDQGFRKKFRKTNATKLFLPTAFPDARVDEAYLHPEVDSDPSPFQWGVPDLDALRGFLMATIGWSQERTDEVLVPVIRDMNRRENEGTQSNITSFITGQAGAGAFAPRVRGDGKSKRMEGALERMAERAKRKRISGEISDGERANDAERANSSASASKKAKDGRGRRPAGEVSEQEDDRTSSAAEDAPSASGNGRGEPKGRARRQRRTRAR